MELSNVRAHTPIRTSQLRLGSGRAGVGESDRFSEALFPRSDMTDQLNHDWLPFSARQRVLERIGSNGGVTRSELPESFRLQAFAIVEDIVGGDRLTPGHQAPVVESRYTPDGTWVELHETVARERGLRRLYAGEHEYGSGELWSKHYSLSYDFIEACDTSLDSRLDFLEISFRLLRRRTSSIGRYRPNADIPMLLDRGVAELNCRFYQHGLGFRFDAAAQMLVLVDSDVLYAEAIEPAFELLSRRGYQAAENSLRRAFTRLREGNLEEAIVAAGQALDGVLKHVVAEENLTPKSNLARDLVAAVCPVLFGKGTAHGYVDSVRTLLERTQTVRNQNAAHGAGPEGRDVPDYIASFALNATATAIMVLLRARVAREEEELAALFENVPF